MNLWFTAPCDDTVVS